MGIEPPCRSALFIGAALATLAPSLAYGSGSFDSSLKSAAGKSEAVLYGEITGKEVHGEVVAELWTRYVLRVDEVLAGALDSGSFEFWCYGGFKDGFIKLADGVPAFDAGEKVILFYDADNWLCGSANGDAGVLREADVPGGSVLTNNFGMTIVGLGPQDVVLGAQIRRRPFWGAPWEELSSESGIDGIVLADATTLRSELRLFVDTWAKSARRIYSESSELPSYGKLHETVQ